METKTISFDYDDDPDRFRTNVRTVEKYGLVGVVHESVADWLASEKLDPFCAVAALYVLYHFPHPEEVLAENHRVMRPGGLFIACAPSRYNDPELAAISPQTPMTFDAENGPDMVAEFFEIIEVEKWDAPLVHLPDKEALAHYLRGRSLSHVEIKRAVARTAVPLNLTKRGALIYACKSN